MPAGLLDAHLALAKLRCGLGSDDRHERVEVRVPADAVFSDGATGFNARIYEPRLRGLFLQRERFKLIPEAHLFLFRDAPRGEEMLMLLRRNTGYEDGNYSVPAGHIDGGEAARAAMAREALEEVGLAIAPEALELCHVMHRRTAADERVSFFFVASQWTGVPMNAEPDKCGEVRWFRCDALPANTVRYVAHALALVQRGVGYSEYAW